LLAPRFGGIPSQWRLACSDYRLSVWRPYHTRLGEFKLTETLTGRQVNLAVWVPGAFLLTGASGDEAERSHRQFCLEGAENKVAQGKAT
jgi:hypothetical protein